MSASPQSTPVALLGLGLMGAGMAANLIKAGFQLTVYNRNPDKAQPFADRARIASTPREAAEAADIVIAMVADDSASRSLWLGEQGALAALKPGAICIDCSTLTPAWVREWADQVQARGGAPLDAPVTGSRPQAQNAELNFLVGGEAAALERARPALAAMGKHIVSLGPIGSGATYKLINNFLAGVQLASLAEAMVWIERSGLNREQVLETLFNGAPASPMVKTVGARMANQDFTPNFHLALMAKDLGYAADEAERSAQLTLSTARTAQQMLQAAAKAGFATQDMSAVYRYVNGERLA